MRYTLVTAPADVVSVDEARAHMRVDSDVEDSPIAIYVAAATAHLDGRTGILGRAIGEQTWRLDTDGPDECDRIEIEMPANSITSVKYLVDGVETTWASDQYRLGQNGNLSFVGPAEGVTWPTADDREDAWRVTFVAGYSTVPAPIKAAILLMAADLYENRETVAVGVSAQAIPMTPTVDRLIASYRLIAL